LQYGLDHVAEWGGIIPGFGQQSTDFHNFISIFLGGRGGKDATMNDQLNVLGNHIISQSLRLDIDILDFKIGTYWQNLSEDGPIRIIGNTMNTPDGLWGLSIRNKKFLPLQGILFEYFNSTDQSGPFHDKDGIVYGGTDGYFLNGVQTGWSFYNRTIGIPLILSPFYNSDGSHQTLNNRVQAFHLGIEGDIVNCQYRFLSTFSKNYGTYGNYFPEMLENTSLLLELNKKLPKLSNIEAGCSIGADFGKLYGNSLGFQLSLRKRGDLFRY